MREFLLIVRVKKASSICNFEVELTHIGNFRAADGEIGDADASD
jgi:hypothetical protein